MGPIDRPLRDQDDLSPLFDGLDTLTAFQRRSLRERYRFFMSEYRGRSLFYTVLFYTLRVTVTAGSLAVPALLSIQQTSIPQHDSALYWFTWSTALAVTASNGLITLFKLDKRFFTLNATMERIRSETWQYLQLSGRYSGHHHHHAKPTHANQFVAYCTQLEKINMKRVEEEFMKNTDSESGYSGPQALSTIPLLRNRAQNPTMPFSSSTSILVPSPALSLITPLLGEDREDSASSVEDADDSSAEGSRKSGRATHSLPLSNANQPSPSVLKRSDTRVVVLSAPQDVQGVTTIGR